MSDFLRILFKYKHSLAFMLKKHQSFSLSRFFASFWRYFPSGFMILERILYYLKEMNLSYALKYDFI